MRDQNTKEVVGFREFLAAGKVLKKLVPNASMATSRAELGYRTGESYGGDRDLYKALGYKQTIALSDYQGRFNRGDIARTIVTAYPDATWRARPVVRELGKRKSNLEVEWRKLSKRLKIWNYANRADILCGIGRYSIMLLGFDDGKPFNEPVTNPKGVEYISVYGEGSVEVGELVTEKSDSRYGLPRFYKIDQEGSGIPNLIHPSRVLHVAEGCLEDDIFGKPRLEAVFNRLMDLELIVGGSAEMFWRGAFPGYGFMADGEAELSSTDITDMNDEIEDFVHNLKRYLRLQGVEVKEFKPQVASPVEHVEVQLQMISGATRIPIRILIGSERGELASTVDESSWLARIDERRLLFAETIIINPFVEKMMEYGILPQVEEYETVWPDMETTNDKAKSEVAQRLTKAITDYARTPSSEVIMPPEIFLKKILQFTDEEIEDIKEFSGFLNWRDEMERARESDNDTDEKRNFPYDDKTEESRRVSNPRAK